MNEMDKEAVKNLKEDEAYCLDCQETYNKHCNHCQSHHNFHRVVFKSNWKFDKSEG